MATDQSGLYLNDKVYAFGKRLSLVILPAVSSLYFALGNIWGFPKIEEVVGTIACVEIFIGAVLGFSSVNYDKTHAAPGVAYDGQIVVTQTEEGKKVFSLEFDGDPQNIDQQDSITFKVAKT
jgi:hypothetical protein